MASGLGSNCNCTMAVIRVLMRIEQLEGVQVGLSTSLEVMEDAEVRCFAVLSCPICRQRRFSLASVTVISATVTEWVRRTWLGGSIDNDVLLGDIHLDRADAEMLSRELMTLQLSHFVRVMTRLETTLSAASSVHTVGYQDIVRSKLQELHDCKDQIHKLSLSG